MIREPKHNIIVDWDSDDNMHQISISTTHNENDKDNNSIVKATISLNPNRNFLTRLRIAFNYAFGIESKVNQFVDFNFNKKHNKALVEIITILNSKSELVKHAKRELILADFYNSKNEYGKILAEDVIQLLSTLATQGHSGGSTEDITTLFLEMVRRDTIAALRFYDDEWISSPEKGLLQNNRNTAFFKTDKGIFNVNAYTKHVKSTKSLGEKEIVKIDGGCYYGSVYESHAGVSTGRYFNRCYVPTFDLDKGYNPIPKIILPTTQIEISKDNWLMFVPSNSSSLKQLEENYNIDWKFDLALKGKQLIKLGNK